MVKRCAWGTCNSDERYPDKFPGVFFVPFPKPKSQIQKCLRWIRACGRPHDQLNPDKINKHKYVCSKHFVNGSGPSKEFPDPLPADGSKVTPTRPPPKRRVFEEKVSAGNGKVSPEKENETFDIEPGVATQTENSWVSPMDMFAQSVEMHLLQNETKKQKQKIEDLTAEIKEKNLLIQELETRVKQHSKFGVQSVMERNKLKNLFQYYTGISYVRFLTLFTFLVPEGFSLPYEKGRTDIRTLSTEDCLFLTLCRLRHNFGLKDIAMRFGLSIQSSCAVFNTCVDHMYKKLGQLSIWPHRDTIIKNMPADFKTEFPTTMVIIDGTEIKTQTPCALGLQSQLYSDYKSSTTLKCLIGCDPYGSVSFISELFTGSISDKAITEQSGFYDLLRDLIGHGFLNEGDAVMADKGFTIEKELNDIGIKLNIPPFASSDSPLPTADTVLTQKIAKHRIHIERLIAKIKKFKIVAHCIPTSLFQRISQIWTVCCHLTLFQDVFVTDKK